MASPMKYEFRDILKQWKGILSARDATHRRMEHQRGSSDRPDSFAIFKEDGHACSLVKDNMETKFRGSHEKTATCAESKGEEEKKQGKRS